MQSTLLQTKPAFSWKARLGTALLLVLFHPPAGHYLSHRIQWDKRSAGFATVQLTVADPGLSVSCRIRVIAAVIGVVLWAASLAALSYYVIYGQEFSQSVLFVMFETNANEASEYLSQYFSLKIVLVAPAYTVAAILLWTRLRPVYIPSPALSGVVCPAVRADPPSHRDEYLYQA